MSHSQNHRLALSSRVVGRVRSKIKRLLIVFLGCLILVLVFLGLVGRAYWVPSASMVPTLLVGDVVFVTKYSFGWRPSSLPVRFARLDGLAVAPKLPKRGDIVVLRKPSSGNQTPNSLVIKRVIGLPGDDVRLINGRLEIRTKPVSLFPLIGQDVGTYHQDVEESAYFRETLPAGLTDDEEMPASYVIRDRGMTRDDNFGPFTVPDRQLFLLGDNRDNSEDSRTAVLSVVPVDNLIGRAQFVLLSIRNSKERSSSVFPFRIDRFFKPLQ